jgi:hypothetical protein
VNWTAFVADQQVSAPDLTVESRTRTQAWSLLGFFVTTVAGLVLEPLSSGAWALMCAGAAVGLHCLTFEEAFAAADTQVLWLIVLAFLLAKVGPWSLGGACFDSSGLPVSLTLKLHGVRRAGVAARAACPTARLCWNQTKPNNRSPGV